MNRLLAVAFVSTIFATQASAASTVQVKSGGPAHPEAGGGGGGGGTCKLTYPPSGGGALIQNAKVFNVFWNQGNTYRDMLTAFYTSITQSAYFDMLTEYNVSNYKIGRGSFLGYYEDTNDATKGASIQDSDIGGYLDGLIAANKIPAPDDNTLYQIYYPASVTITLQGEKSCSYFCAYHSSYSHGGQMARYSVIPDVTTAPCKGGCGSSTTQFNNLTSVSSHEMIEAITDPDGGTSWYDSTGSCNPTGEIGDICNGEQCTSGGTLRGDDLPDVKCGSAGVVEQSERLHRAQSVDRGERLHGDGRADDAQRARRRHGDREADPRRSDRLEL